MQVIGLTKPTGVVKAKACTGRLMGDPPLWGRNPGASKQLRFCLEQQEHARWNPKDGELCLVRLKSGETLMEDRSDSDVQIDRRSWV